MKRAVFAAVMAVLMVIGAFTAFGGPGGVKCGPTGGTAIESDPVAPEDKKIVAFTPDPDEDIVTADGISLTYYYQDGEYRIPGSSTGVIWTIWEHPAGSGDYRATEHYPGSDPFLIWYYDYYPNP